MEEDGARGESRGKEREIKGRRRSEGGERMTRIRRKEEGDAEKQWPKGECGKCGEVLWVVVKEKGMQVEMGHRGCCTLRKTEQQVGGEEEWKTAGVEWGLEGGGRERRGGEGAN